MATPNKYQPVNATTEFKGVALHRNARKARKWRTGKSGRHAPALPALTAAALRAIAAKDRLRKIAELIEDQPAPRWARGN